MIEKYKNYIKLLINNYKLNIHYYTQSRLSIHKRIPKKIEKYNKILNCKKKKYREKYM